MPRYGLNLVVDVQFVGDPHDEVVEGHFVDAARTAAERLTTRTISSVEVVYVGMSRAAEDAPAPSE